MSAQVISISSVPRSGHQWEAEAELAGFVKALGLVKSLQPASPTEKRIAVENWVNGGILSEEEREAVAEYFGWERAP